MKGYQPAKFGRGARVNGMDESSSERLAKLAQQMVSAGIMTVTPLEAGPGTYVLSANQPVTLNGINMVAGDMLQLSYTYTSTTTLPTGQPAVPPAWIEQFVTNLDAYRNAREDNLAIRQSRALDRIKANRRLYMNNFRPQEGEQLGLNEPKAA